MNHETYNALRKRKKGITFRSQYADDLKRGEDWQDYVETYIRRATGLSLGIYRTHREQISKGESRTGVEIKLDARWSETGNQYLEIEQRSTPAFDFSPSGLYHPGTRWLLNGNWQKGFYLYRASDLREWIAGLSTADRTQRTRRSATSVGLLLYPEDADGLYTVACHFTEPVSDSSTLVPSRLVLDGKETEWSP